MGREDPLFFEAALCAGSVLAEMVAVSDERIESLGGETRFEGSQFQRPRRALPLRRRRGGAARARPARGRCRGRRLRRRARLARAPAARGDRRVHARAPAGKLDVEGESPLQTAKRELAEEIGREAEHWEPVVSYHPTIGYSNEMVHVFAATGLRESDVEPIPGERIEIVRWPLTDLAGAIAATTDSKTLLGLHWLRSRRA